MKKVFLILMVFSFTMTCKTSDIVGFKDVKYTTDFLTSSKEEPFKEKTYVISIPKGFKIDKEDFNPEYKEIIYNYENGMKIYITDNTMGGSALNGDNKLAQGITVIKRKSLRDSIYMKGKQKDGYRYWKENILNDVVIGYLNVSKERKAEFDKSIASIVRK